MPNNLFPKSRYLKLLEKENNNNLFESKFRKLLSYRIILENQITYNKRKKYISLLEEHVKFNFENLETCLDNDDNYSPMVELSELFEQDSEYYDLSEKKILKEGIAVLDNFSIDSTSSSEEFANLISFIDHLDEIYEEFSYQDYSIEIETTLLLLQDCGNETARN